MKIPTITLHTKFSPSLHETIVEVLALQSTLTATRDTANAENGFLISVFSSEELLRLVENDGKLYTAHFDNELAGYLLITPISEFTGLLTERGTHSSGGKFTPTVPIQYEDYDYLYQIGVGHNMKGRAVGRTLLTRARETTLRGLLTDVLTEPVPNTVSLRFFEKFGFQTVGILELSEYRTFGKLKSQVFTWKP